MLLYIAQTYREYFERTKQSLYGTKKVQMPVPEIYVIYTGDRKERPAELSLSKEFFGGREGGIDVKIKMVYDGKDGDIISQYVLFTKICNEQVVLYGRTRRAIQEAIRICKDRNVLKEYLASKEKEVMDMMWVLYDEQEVVRSYIESEVYAAGQQGLQQGLQQGEQKGEAKIIVSMHNKGFTAEQIAAATDKDIKEIESIIANNLHVV